ncbi:MAG: hypothetical protein KDA84_25210, partial [Planctomycetaceae bacterium]|nr:hypothetical protein [Planctomycetaceae bacterium]
CSLTPFRNPSGNLHPAYYKLGFWYSSECLQGLSRETFAQAMRWEGIALDPGFRALHLSHSKRRYRAVGELPHATRADTQILTLHHPLLLEGQTAVQQFLAAFEKIQQHAEALHKWETSAEP